MIGKITIKQLVDYTYGILPALGNGGVAGEDKKDKDYKAFHHLNILKLSVLQTNGTRKIAFLLA
jgi:hypothetical protein